MTTTRIRFADSEVAALSARYRAGVSIEELSRQTGRDRRVLRRVLTEAGVRLRTPRPLPVEQTPLVINQYQRGATLRELAELTGCSYSSIRRVLLQAGVTLRARGGTRSSWSGEAR
ncbi:MAG: helix-turn-helix domain-containing protein [Pseudonocardiaceae bacterium]